MEPAGCDIVHVITRLDLGGSAQNTLLTAIGFCRKGYRVGIICGVSENPPSTNEKTARDLGIPIRRISRLKRAISPLDDLLSLVMLYRCIRKERCTVVHTHTSKAGILGRIAARLAGVPGIVHTPHGHVFDFYFSPAITRLFILVERWATSFTDVQITLTRAEKRDYLERSIGTEAGTVPIYSGVELGPFLKASADRPAVRRSLGLDEDSYVAGTVGRLDPVKNHDLIVSAAALVCGRLPDVRFVFVGDGALRQALEERIASLDLTPRFVFAGWRDDIPDLLRAFDLFVLCSHNEGMGRVFVEAQAAGVPVVGSRVCGIPEVLIEGETGDLVAPDNQKELAETIEKWYNQRERAAETARACREWVDPRFSVDAMVERIEDVYRRLLREKVKAGKDKD